MAVPTPRKRGARGLQYAAVGLEFAVIVVVAVIAGSQLDRRLGSEPFGMLFLTVGGFAAAVRRLIWSLKRHS